jgi:hypothetical protein
VDRSAPPPAVVDREELEAFLAQPLSEIGLVDGFDVDEVDGVLVAVDHAAVEGAHLAFNSGI